MAAQNTCTFAITAAVLVFARSGVLCAPLCLTGDFDSQLQHILDTQLISAQDPEITGVLNDVQTTLNKRWPGSKITLCGSISTGLGTRSGDVDIAAHIPNFNPSAGLYVLKETSKLFKQQPKLYTRMRYRHNVNIIQTFFSCLHIPSKRILEIEFQTGDAAVANSKLFRYYFKLDKRFIPLGGILKYWFKTRGILGHRRGLLPSYGLCLLVIFYLQQKNMVPPGYVLQVNSKSNYIDNWDMGFNKLPYRSMNTESLHQLLGGFFKYYSEFNFEQYIVSPFTGRPIPKSAFKDIDNFPIEYSFKYNNTLKRKIQRAIKKNFDMSTDVCIQDVFMHDINNSGRLTERATKLKYLLKSVAAMFEVLPSDSILRAMLVMDGHNKTVADDCRWNQ